MEIKYQTIKKCVILYAAIPIFVFFIGWLNLLSATISVILLAALVFLLFREAGSGQFHFSSVNISRRQIVTLAVIALAWCILAGQGGLMHQSADHEIRNKIFLDMIVEPWPVTYNDDKYMLCYYIAHWTVPAVIGKIAFVITGTQFTGYIVGNITLLIWSSAGVFMVLLLITMVTNTGKKVRPIVSSTLFILFSGLDRVASLIKISNYSDHLEWWASYFQYSSNTTCLFWVYNQTIVIWLIVLCIINELSPRNLAGLGMLALPFGPFPFVGIIILCAIKMLFMVISYIRDHKISLLIKDILSMQNIFGILAIAPVYILYYASNIIVSNTVITSSGKKIESGFRLHSDLTEYISDGNTSGLFDFWTKYLLFVFLEFGIYIVILTIAAKLRKKNQDGVLIGSAVALLVIPFFQIGTGYDFSMRTSIPLLLYVCVSVIRFINIEFPEKNSFSSMDIFIKKNAIFLTISFVFFIGAITPITEFRREISSTILHGNAYCSHVESLNNYYDKYNFASENYKASAFYKIMRK